MKLTSVITVSSLSILAIGDSAYAADSTIYLDYSNVSAAGSTITITRLPIKLPSGSFIYKDVTVQLAADGNGALTYSPSTPVQPLSPPLKTNNFLAGTYQYTPETGYGFALSGPSGVPGSTETKWETNAVAGETNTCGTPAVFYVGPLASNPNYARIHAAGITSTEYSYGVIGGGSVCGTNENGGDWAANALVGFSQSGTLLTIATFTNSSIKDQSTPVTYYNFSKH
jgi:hypothetical protein